MSSDSETDILLFDSSVISRCNIYAPIRRHRYWMHGLFKDRVFFSEYYVYSIKLERYPRKFFEYYRMKQSTYKYILNSIEQDITHNSTYREVITAGERLTITIRYLSTGISFRSLAQSFRVSHCSVTRIISEVCDAIWNRLVETHMPVPTANDFKQISKRFFERWQFPNCIGTIDGKHIRIKCPNHSGSRYYNYRHFFSLVLQGVADADRKFIFVDVGGYGRQSDGGTFSASSLQNAIRRNSIVFPQTERLFGTTVKFPYYFLGDDAYPLLPYLMKPYKKKQINERRRFIQ